MDNYTHNDIIKNGADIKDKEGNNLLHKCQDKETIKLIINTSKVNLLNKKNNNGDTPLHLCTDDKCIDYMISLYNKKNMRTKINIKNNDGMYPIYEKSADNLYYLKNNYVIKTLLAHSEDPNKIINSKDSNGNTLLHLGDNLKYYEDENFASNDKLTMSKTDNTKFINLIDVVLKYKPNLFAKNNDGHIPSMLYIGSYLIKIIKYANKNKIDIINEKYPNTNRTSLFYANNITTARFLIKNGADVNVKDIGGNTPLFYILKKYAKSDNDQFIELFIKNGADVNVKDKEGNTLISYIKNNNIIKKILKKS